VTAAVVAAVIRSHRFGYATEAELQQGLYDALTAAGLPVRREVTIAPGCRVDHLVGRVAVEVKVHGTAAEADRQLRRYLATGKVDGIVLVTNRVGHLALQSAQVEVVGLARHGL
jgi:hypothetical protein